MKRILFIFLLTLPVYGQFGNATRIRGLNIKAPLTCVSDGFGLVWVAASLRFECITFSVTNGVTTTAGATFGAFTYDFTGSTLLIPNSAISTAYLNGLYSQLAAANLHGAGTLNTFTHDATNPGFRLGLAAGAPSTPVDGAAWYNSSTPAFYGRENGVTYRLAHSGTTTLPALTSIGTIGTGVWQGTPIASAFIANNAVTSTQTAVVNTRRVCDIGIGDTSGSALTNAQLGPQKRVCFIPAASTVVEVIVAADAGTPNVIVGRNVAGTQANILSAALATAASGGIACSNATGVTGIDGVTTCSATLQNTALAVGSYLELVSGTAGGIAKWMSVHVTYTVN